VWHDIDPISTKYHNNIVQSRRMSADFAWSFLVIALNGFMPSFDLRW